jgi:hypothetical protein
MTSEPGAPELSHYVPQGYRISAVCDRCGWPCIAGSGQGCAGSGYDGGTGYGYRGADRAPLCYDCCAMIERRDMIETGRGNLYLVGKKLSDWPGLLTFTVIWKVPFHHPFSRSAVIAYFVGPDGKPWSAKRIGDMDLCHSRRIKKFPFHHAANNQRRESDSITFPAYWASALINGDYSGMDEAESAQCKRAEKKLALQGWSVVSVGDSYFTNSYASDSPFSGDVADFTIVKGG